MRTTEKITIGNNQIETTYYRFFVESIGEPVDWILEQCGFKHQPIMELPKIEPVKVFSKYMALPGGKLMRTYTMYSLPGTLWPGFLYDTYGIADRIMLRVRPLPP
ncbi:MAG: hypothetical protein JRD69_09985, partial [Deltaproteobacteria bacterium]|nr:hypothetical protein [Deltaproteobacteria bacterium]